MTETSSNPIRLGVIGLGLITQSQHLPNLLGGLRDRFSVTHVCDLSEALAATIGAETGARHTTDAATLIADPEVDAVLICTPGAHSTVARRALEAGKHVLAEKPYSYDPAIAERDAAFAAEKGLVLQVGYMKMYEPVIEAARERFVEIGPLHLVRMTVLHPSDDSQTDDLPIKRFSDVGAEAIAAAQAQNQSEVTAALAGQTGIDPALFRNVLHGSVCHQTSVLRALFPEQEARLVSAHQNAPASERSEPPKMQVIGAIDDGPDWILSWNWLTDYPEYQEWIEIYGHKGSLRIDFPPPYRKGELARLTMTTSTPDKAVAVEILAPNGPSAFSRELAAFADSIGSGAPILSDGAGAGRDATILRDIAAHLS